MEDSIEESERLVSHLNLDTKEEDAKEKAEDEEEGKAGLGDEKRGVGKVEEVRKEEEEELGGGIINQLISNYLLKPKGEEDEGEGKAGLDDEVGVVEKLEEEKTEEEVESGGGVINKFISNLHNSKGEEDKEEGKAVIGEVNEEKKEEESDGVIDHLISNSPVSLPPAISGLSLSHEYCSFFFFSFFHYSTMPSFFILVFY